MVRVISISQSQRDLKQFHQLAMDVHARPSNISGERFSQLKKELFDTAFLGKQCVLLAYEGEEPVARVVARLSPNLQDNEGRPYGLLGFFESHDNSLAVKELFDKAFEWFEEQGVTTVAGPMRNAAWFSHRFNLGPYDRVPYLYEPYNPSYYPEMWEEYGFRAAGDYYSRHIEDIDAQLDLLKLHHQKCLQRGVRFRAMKPHKIHQELDLSHQIAKHAFESSPYFSNTHETIFSRQYTQLKSWVKKQLVHFAFDDKNNPIAFIYALPDYAKLNLAAKLSPGKLGKIDTVNVYTIAVKPQYQRMGIASALTYLCYKNALKLGFHQANFCVMKEGNPMDKINHAAGTVFRRYRLYQKDI